MRLGRWAGPSKWPADLGQPLAAAGHACLGDSPGRSAIPPALTEGARALPRLAIVPVAGGQTLRDRANMAGEGDGE